VRPGAGIGTALAVAIEEEHVAVPAVVAAHLGATVRAVPGIASAFISFNCHRPFPLVSSRGGRERR
jgi:hypothetical protein